MQELQANTIATILIGPFVDKGDGVTPEEGVTLAAADSAEVMKHDGTTFVDIAGAGGNQCTLTHKEKGMYTLAIPAAVISDEGRMTVFISDESVCLPVWKDFMVLAQAAWISKYTAKDSGYMDVDVKAVGGTATPHTSGKLHVLQGDGNAITAVGPTKAQMDTAHALLATPAQVATELGTYDGPTKAELDTAIALVTDDLDNVTDGLGALKDLLDTISGYTDLIDDATNGLAAIKAEVEGIGGVAMRGTDSVVLAGPTKAQMDTAIALCAQIADGWDSALATILDNLSATRIGYLDELDFGLTEAIAAIQTDLGDFSGRTNNKSLLAVLGVPDTAAKDLHTLLVTDRLDHATYGLSALETLVDSLETYCDILDHATNGLANIKALIDTAQGVLDKLDSAMEADVAVYRFTENALEEGPSGGAIPTAEEIADQVWDELEANHQTDDTMGAAMSDATEITLEED